MRWNITEYGQAEVISCSEWRTNSYTSKQIIRILAQAEREHRRSKKSGAKMIVPNT